MEIRQMCRNVLEPDQVCNPVPDISSKEHTVCSRIIGTLGKIMKRNIILKCS